MSKFLTFICGVTLVLGFAGVALATTFTDTVYDPTYINVLGSHDWQHNITDDGFDPIENTLDSATLELFLSDDWDPLVDDIADATNTVFEIATVSAGGQLYDLGEIDFGYYTVSLTAWIQLQETGLLDVTLTSTQGDFWFIASELVATNPNASIPDASAVFLLGSACLIGFVTSRRKKRR